MEFLRSPRASAADRLLLAILQGGSLDDGQTRQVDETWTAILGAARCHGVHSLVAYCMTRNPDLASRLAPATVMSSRDMLHKATLFNMLRDENLKPVVTALAEHRIPAVLLKGVSLVRTAYPHPGTRLSRDVDLLVDTAQVDLALAVLRDLGFRSQLARHEIEHFRARHFHLALNKGRFVVEVHWDLVRPDSPYSLPGRVVFGRALAPPNGEGLLLESPEDQVLHAAAQSLSEGFSGLLRVCDVHMVLQRTGESLDWEEIASRARHGRLAPAVALLVKLVHRLLGSSPPRGAELLHIPHSVFFGLEPLLPGRSVLDRFSKKRLGFAHLLRFWLLPGARRRVVEHFLRGDPRDRTLPALASGGPPSPWRPLLVARRLLMLAGLAAYQITAFVARRRDEPPCDVTGG